MAPAALAYRMIRSRSHPASSPWQSAPPNASPAPSPLTTSTGSGGTSAVEPSRWVARTPFGPCLTTASSTPAASRARAAACGSRSPVAISHSSMLPTATVAWAMASR